MEVTLEAAPEQLAERVPVAHAVEQHERPPYPPGAEVDRDPLGVEGVGMVRYALRSTAAAVAWSTEGVSR